ncbi:flagellar biosynthetic protein FliO [Methylophilus aquaticus]|uniref:Flagellar protein n=1 Tax=Methylophilus aquaticus TaxID=1971610 RepID=A0ABT9JU81_9PROT|nr:flagellar biosynthetic protein FliO [Methylophilus aquaticus]MDP8568117.1 flagellar biosynthetic protein FliO [Methylophilus aquaticus]
MKYLKTMPWLLLVLLAHSAEAAEAMVSSVGDGLGRMVLGTVIVLLVIGGMAWVARRVLPGQGMTQAGVIKQVGGVHLGPRERVVVLEVAGRWLVVGVSPGQMTALGEVPAIQSTPAPLSAETSSTLDASVINPQDSFATRLQQAMQQTVKSLKNKP